MASNRAIVVGLVVVGAAFAATEYAVAHHFIELPDFIPNGIADAPAAASADAADAPAATAGD